MGQQTYRICFIESAQINTGEVVMGEDYTPGDSARYSYLIQEEGVTIRLCIQDGSVVLYASLTVPNPNRALNDFALDAILHGDICEDVFVDPNMIPNVQEGRRKRQVSSSPERILFVSIEGIAESSTFTLETTMGNTANYTVTCAQSVCGRNTNCTDDPFGYSCVCLTGYVFGPDLIDCQDINECARYPSHCSQFANCSNTNGSTSYECSCQPTHKGDGVRCILNENSNLKFILTIACSVGGGVLLLVVLVAAVVIIYKVMTASKHSPYNERGNNPAVNNPAVNNLDASTNDDKILLHPENTCTKYILLL